MREVPVSNDLDGVSDVGSASSGEKVGNQTDLVDVSFLGWALAAELFRSEPGRVFSVVVVWNPR